MLEQAKTIFDIIKKYDTVIIHRHKKPDGDALGAQIGLREILRLNFPDKKIYAVGDDAGRYSFMEDSEMDRVEDGMYRDALAIILDTSAPALISDDRYLTAESTVRFDHHIFIDKIANVELVDTSFESCAGLVACAARDAGMKFDALAAKSFFTGMVTDSGRFRYDTTSPRTFETAAFLLGYGFSASDIYSELYADDFEMIKLRASFVMNIKFSPHGVAYIYTDRERLKETGADGAAISRGMVNTMSDIRGVDIWVNFTEDGDAVLCEIRSKKYNINPVATKYGGGGHAKASGATLKNSEEAYALLSDLDKIAEGQNE